MKRRFRLTNSTEFQRVRRFGKSYAHPLLVLVIYPNDLEKSRFGFAAGKSCGNAVKRNRAKRRMRALAAKYLSIIEPGYDVIMIARKSLNDAGFDQLHSAIKKLLVQAGLLEFNGRNPQA